MMHCHDQFDGVSFHMAASWLPQHVDANERESYLHLDIADYHC
jgi:hypothetical protein